MGWQQGEGRGEDSLVLCPMAQGPQCSFHSTEQRAHQENGNQLKWSSEEVKLSAPSELLRTEPGMGTDLSAASQISLPGCSIMFHSSGLAEKVGDGYKQDLGEIQPEGYYLLACLIHTESHNQA